MVQKRTKTNTPTPVKKSFIFRYTAATAGLYATLLTPVIVGLSLKLISIDAPECHYKFSFTRRGRILAVIANPLFGRLSDRTTSRLGMRRPWLLGGSVTGVLGLLVIALSNTVPGILIGWCIAQVAFCATLAALPGSYCRSSSF